MWNRSYYTRIFFSYLPLIIFIRDGKVGWAVRAGLLFAEKKTERVAYFNPFARLSPSHIISSPHGSSVGWGGLTRLDPHNFKMYNFFFTPIFFSYSLIFYIPNFLITFYYTCFMNIIL